MALTLDTPLTPSLAPRSLLRKLARSVAFAILLIMTAAAGWYLSLNRVTDLGKDNQLVNSGALAQWQQGNVIVLIRHAERCDQSSNACLGPPDGITLAGTQVAQGVGIGLEKLGLVDAQVLASPLTRTRQTASFIFGREIPTASWVGNCDAGFAGSLMTQKTRHRNMVLVTHSGCIDHLLRKLHVQPGERDSDYTEALLVSVNGQGKPHLLGSMKADQWQKLSVFQE